MKYYCALGVFVLLLLAAWLTHIVDCLKHHEYFALVAGAIAAPIGVIHGVGIWFGIW